MRSDSGVGTLRQPLAGLSSQRGICRNRIRESVIQITLRAECDLDHIPVSPPYPVVVGAPL